MESNGTITEVEQEEYKDVGMVDKDEDTEGLVDLLPEQELAISRYRIIKTGCIAYIAFSLGMCGGITGTTVLDLMDNLEHPDDISMGQFSLALSMKNLGLMVGSLIGGLCCDRYQEQTDVILTISALLMGLCAILKPYVTYLGSMAAVFFLDGAGGGSIGAVGLVTTVQLWGDRGDAPLQIVQTGWAVGFALSPLIAWPFIIQREDEDDEANTTYFTTTTNYNLTEEVEESMVHVPYIIVGLAATVGAVLFLVIYIIGSPPFFRMFSPRKSTWKQTMSPGSCAGGDSAFAIEIIILSVIFFATLYVRETIFDTYLYSVAIEGDLQMSTDEAVLLDFTCKMMFLIGRILAIPFAYAFPVQPFLHAMVYTTALLGVFLATPLGVGNSIGLWIIGCSLQLFSGPMWGLGYSWVDKYIILYAAIIAMTDIGNGITGFIFLILGGFIYSEYYPETVFYIVAGAGIVMSVVLPFMQILGSRHGNRFRIIEKELNERDSHLNASVSSECTKL